MLRTEEEARTYWCPFARVAATVNGGASAANRTDKGVPYGSLCIASGCMAWRVAEPERDNIVDTVSRAIPPGETNPPFSNCPDGYVVAMYGRASFTADKIVGTCPARGYCGLAGRPE